MNNHNANFKYKGMKTDGVTDYTNQTPPKQFGWKNPKLNSPKIRKYLSNMHYTGGAHAQCMNSHYAKFEYKGMKTVGVTIYTNQTLSKHFERKND